MDDLLNRYREAAVRFVPRCEGAVPLRVAATPVTCRVAAAALNRLRVPAEPACAYRHVNVHNPRCPLHYDAAQHGWQCSAALAEHPVWCLSWAGARLVSEGLGARLPHACEWECFAANNEPGRTYPWGNGPPSGRLANYDELYGGPTEAGRFPPNEIGLFDLAGNVGEWCLDALGGTGSLERVVKGGAWSKDACHLRIRDIRGKWARLGTTTIGLRPVWDD